MNARVSNTGQILPLLRTRNNGSIVVLLWPTRPNPELVRDNHPTLRHDDMPAGRAIPARFPMPHQPKSRFACSFRSLSLLVVLVVAVLATPLPAAAAAPLPSETL